MSNELQKVMQENRTLLQDAVCLRLNASDILNNQELDDELLRGRVVLMVDKFLASLPDTPEIFVSYVESITDERIDEGILLPEMQLALVVLEESVWQLVVESIPPEDQVSCLGLITSIVGTAKDRVAQIFLHHLAMVESEVALLRRQMSIMELGPDSAPDSEDDQSWLRGNVILPLGMA